MAAPVNLTIPTITGTVAVGQALSLSDGTWSNSPTSYSYAWLRSGTAIAGATGNIYVVTREDIGYALVGRVTATNVDGSATADSLPTVAVPSTLIVETGAIVSNADSYVSLAYAREYHDKMGNTAWASIATDNLREQYIRRAMAYLAQTYSFAWKGHRASSTQPLDWPRTFVELPASDYGGYLANNIVPSEVKDAVCELALKAATTTLNPDSTQSVKKKTVGPIMVEYDMYSRQSAKYNSINDMLRKYTKANGISVDMVRA